MAKVAAETDWGAKSTADTMLCALLRLPPHLLHRVMSVCVQDGNLSSFLGSVPASLHVAAVSAAVEDGCLSMSFDETVDILTPLSSASFPAPGLQVVSLHLGFSSTMPASVGGLLACALAAHPTLTRLESDYHGSGLNPQWLRSFAACLRSATLPNLVHLEVHVAAHPNGCVELAACLRLLPALTSLRTTFNTSQPRNAAPVPLSRYARLASAPATLPHLQELVIYEDD